MIPLLLAGETQVVLPVLLFHYALVCVCSNEVQVYTVVGCVCLPVCYRYTHIC